MSGYVDIQSIIEQILFHLALIFFSLVHPIISFLA